MTGHHGVPIRADMSTTIAGPMGIAESNALTSGSSASAQQLKRRGDAKAMLTQRLQKQYGSDPVRAALVKLEVDRCEALRRGKMTHRDLDVLEQSVAEAVKAHDITHTRIPTGLSERRLASHGAEYYRDARDVADWSKVAAFQVKTGALSMQQEELASAKKTADLRAQLSTQRFEARAKTDARTSEKRAELESMRQKVREYEQEAADAEAARKAHTRQQAKERADQIVERQARRAVERRLKHLEDAELIQSLQEEQEAQKRAAELRRAEQREENRQAELAFEEARRHLKEAKQLEAKEDMRLAQEWKAILDKQEADREAYMKHIKNKIHTNQHFYEDTVGVVVRQRAQKEEERRRQYIEAHDAQQRADDEARKAKRQEMILMQTRTLQHQMQELHDRRQVSKKESRLDAQQICDEAADHERRVQQETTEQRAKAIRQQRDLAEQIAKKQQRRKMSSKMTELEVALNRDLLVSMMDADASG